MMNIRYLNVFFSAVFLFINDKWDGVLEWQTFTGMNEIREILFVDDKIYTGTNGGFFIFDESKNDYKIINNTSGLSYNDIKDMTFDEKGRIWIGLGNGFIDIYDVETEEWNTCPYCNHKLNKFGLCPLCDSHGITDPDDEDLVS